MVENSIGANIRKQRKIKKLTIEQLAARVGISEVFLGLIERGKNLPSIITFAKIVNVLEISADVILDNYVDSAKALVLNSVTEKMQDLTIEQINTTNSVVETLINEMTSKRE